MKAAVPILALLVAVVLVLSQSLYTVDQKQFAIKFQLGEFIDASLPVEAIVSADRLTAIGMGVWTSDGFHPNGDRFDRPGRTTVTLGRKAAGDPFIATHTHMSLFRGTPEQSFGKFG